MHAFRINKIENTYQSIDVIYRNSDGREIRYLAMIHLGLEAYFKDICTQFVRFPGLVIAEGNPNRSRRRKDTSAYRRMAYALGYALQRDIWSDTERRLEKTNRLVRGDLPSEEREALFEKTNPKRGEDSEWEQYKEQIFLAVIREVAAGRILWEWLNREHTHMLDSWVEEDPSERSDQITALSRILARDSRLSFDEWRRGFLVYLELYGYEEQTHYSDSIVLPREQKLKKIIEEHYQNNNLVIPWGGGHLANIHPFIEGLGYTIAGIQWHTAFYVPRYSFGEVRTALLRLIKSAKKDGR